ncbi:MAG TPA: hypothetical protein VLA72_23050 [Anaerolineales bacterium]|nr:hypothetical protein [Anaerolineales bacterium]
MNKGTSKAEKKQESRELETRCWEFLKPFLEELHRSVDRRLVKTLLDLVMVILMHRNRNNGLLHSAKWKSDLILKYLWGRANEKRKDYVLSVRAKRLA